MSSAKKFLLDGIVPDTHDEEVMRYFKAQEWPDKEQIKQRFCNEIKAAIERAAEDFKP